VHRPIVPAMRKATLTLAAGAIALVGVLGVLSEAHRVPDQS
jgi:hypothetical protein